MKFNERKLCMPHSEREVSISNVVATHQRATVEVEGEKFTFTTAPQTEVLPIDIYTSNLTQFEPSIRQQLDYTDARIADQEEIRKVRKISNRVLSGAGVIATGGLISSLEISGDGNPILEGAIGVVALGFVALSEKGIRKTSKETQTKIDHLGKRRAELYRLWEEVKPHHKRRAKA
jgi:hypothetical protein